MRILLVTDGITPYVLGGMQKHSALIAKYLNLFKHEVTLVHCVPYGQELPTERQVNDELLIEGQLHKIHALSFPPNGKFPGHYIRNSYKYACDVYELVEEELGSFDLIYTQGFTGWKFIEEKKKGVKMPLVSINFHGLNMFQLTPDLKTKLMYKTFFVKPVKFMHQYADVIFSFGGKILDHTKKIAGKNAKIIEQTIGIDASWLDDKVELNSTSTRKFLFVGRYERLKGIEELTSVIEQVIDRYTVEFHFVGPIPKDKQVEHKRIIYHGEIRDEKQLKTIFKEMDVLVCPSFSEGMPTVILEGMASGCAIIASDVGAVNVLVDENVGFLVSPGSKEQLKEKIVFCVEVNENELTEMKRAGVSKVKENFTWNLTMEKINKEIIEIVEQCNV